ncbi:major facilitator superfamily domain-containing protein 10-like [Argiope bruennichi]|nr:major facilitator superfamily domain-containing protein 10-like [Argiope bruennichi]XP_055950119.1 major facilitator superfamily domain-containing protein 10-like [Argiope bruennichi]XP_055950120.1 major facilitator superfamily domain-containing protein 10-like [Argiope bruennichi]XP_055950121.1 major facilitator superfamily domain-containing protein 10-like [Argiope bruennichi]KAF8774109.1 Major facilitator superfamily like protein [Argiope bruennichi]
MSRMHESGDVQKQQMSASKKENEDKLSSSMYIIFLVLIVDLLGFTVILPLMPSIFEYYDANEKDHLYHWMESKIHFFQTLFGAPGEFNKVLFSGFIGSVFSALQFLVAPIFGSLSDVYGRKIIMIISMIGIAISHAVWCISDYFYLFVIARIIGGLSRANISLSTAIVTDLCSEKKRSKGMALIGIAFAIGFIVGPVIGAIFASRGEKFSQNFYVLPAIFALTMTIIDIFLIVFFFKESLPKEKRASSIGQGLSEAYQFISPLSLFSFNPVINIKPKEKQALKKIGLTYFLFLFIYSGLEYSLSFLTHMRFNFTSMQQGKMYLFSGLIMIFVQGGYVRRIPPGKEIKSAAVGALLIIPAFVLIGISNRVEILYLGLALYAYASATVVPCLTTIASKFGSTSQKGTVLGIFRSLGSLARALGPLVSAVAYWSLTPTVSYCIGGLLLIIPLVLILNLNKELPKVFEKGD